MEYYNKGERVFYFDSFLGNIIASTVESFEKDTFEVKTESGFIIDTHHTIRSYTLSNGVSLPWYMLFRDPIELIERYLVYFGELRHNNLCLFEK